SPRRPPRQPADPDAEERLYWYGQLWRSSCGHGTRGIVRRWPYYQPPSVEARPLPPTEGPDGPFSPRGSPGWAQTRAHDLLRAYAIEQTRVDDTEDERHAALWRMLDHYLHTAHAAGSMLQDARNPIALPEPSQAWYPGTSPI